MPVIDPNVQFWTSGSLGLAGFGVQLQAGPGCKLALAAAGGMMAVVIGLLVIGRVAVSGRLYRS
jgi:hypothetical protein